MAAQYNNDELKFVLKNVSFNPGDATMVLSYDEGNHNYTTQYLDPEEVTWNGETIDGQELMKRIYSVRHTYDPMTYTTVSVVTYPRIDRYGLATKADFTTETVDK